MKQQTAIISGLLAFALGATVAQAQTYYYPPYPYAPPAYIPYAYGPPRVYRPGIPPQEVMRIVRSRGLMPLSRPMRRGPTYVVIAAARSGGQVQVVVNAMTGDVIATNSRLAMRPYGAPNGGPPPDGAVPPYGPPGARFDGGIRPVPPNGLRNPRTATAPADRPPAIPRTSINPRSADAPPARVTPRGTPMPRRRPEGFPNDSTAAAPAASIPTPEAPAQQPAPAQPAPSTMVPVAPLE